MFLELFSNGSTTSSPQSLEGQEAIIECKGSGG